MFFIDDNYIILCNFAIRNDKHFVIQIYEKYDVTGRIKTKNFKR